MIHEVLQADHDGDFVEYQTYHSDFVE